MKFDLSKYIRNIPDFPKKGILFRDITTLLKDKTAFNRAIGLLAKDYLEKKVDFVVAVEARGFILGGALAYKLNCGFIPVRKKGKLPYKSYQATYNLEYGIDTLEIHRDSILKGAKVLICDDLLATGGTIKAVVDLVKRLKAKILGIVFLIELTDLRGRDKLRGYPVKALIRY